MISPPFRKPWIRAWNIWIITKLLKKSLTNLLFIMLNTWSFVKNFTSKPIYSSNRIIGNKSQKNRSIYNKKPLILKKHNEHNRNNMLFMYEKKFYRHFSNRITRQHYTKNPKCFNNLDIYLLKRTSNPKKTLKKKKIQELNVIHVLK